MTKKQHELNWHPVRALLPALKMMELLGHDRRACLAGTGVEISQLGIRGQWVPQHSELRLYRNILEMTGDPLIGLKLGEWYVPQQYGLFGYALLSAETFRHALAITENYGRLTFSLFRFRCGEENGAAWFSLFDPPDLELDLLNLYFDRDLSAARADFRTVLGGRLPLDQVYLPHDGRGQAHAYGDYFGCEARFDRPDARLVFDSNFLDQPLPQGDPGSARHLRQQCQMLIAKLTSQGRFVDDVRMMILARPGHFPDIDGVAAELGMSTRTLRRRLKEEQSSYREILDEVRYGLAREYLKNTELPIDEVSRLLGYTDSGNFSHAFRRWSDSSPSRWRQAQSSSPLST